MDRNECSKLLAMLRLESLSARRAWIEMSIRKRTPAKPFVALRKESVDRNPIVPAELTTLVKSLSARRAWIEIVTTSDAENRKRRRSPQGERG